MNFTPKPTGAPLFPLLNVALHILRLRDANPVMGESIAPTRRREPRQAPLRFSGTAR